MKPIRATALLLLALGLTAPALAQPVDPFEAIVADRDGAEVALRDVAVPLRNPSESELRQYLEAFRLINLSAAFTVDDRRGHDAAWNVPAGEATLGPFSVENGSAVRLQAEFTKRSGESEAVLRTLEMIPANPMALGPLRFDRMTMDGDGVLHLKLALELMGLRFWPQELTIEKIYRDRAGNLVFETGGSGLAGKFVPDLRIQPDGGVQRYSRGFLGIGRGWKDLEVDGKKVSVAASLPIERWPPRATDLLSWLPGAEPAPTSSGPIALPAIPITDISVGFRAVADPRRITLEGGRGYLDLSNHEMRFDANGRFEDRTYVSDEREPNGYRATATVNGEVRDPALGRARIDRLDLEVSGTHRERLPFDRMEELELEAGLAVRGSARLAEVEAGLPGGPRVAAGGSASAELDVAGAVVLRPLTGNPEDKKELTISKDSRYALDVTGPVTVTGLSDMTPGVELPERLEVRAADDPATPDVDESLLPALEVDGTLGSRMGFLFARTDIDLRGETVSPGALGVLEGLTGGTRLESTLKPGARVHVDAYAFAGIKEETLEGGGVRVTADARVAGTATNTRVEGHGLTATLPGEADLEARAAMNVRYGTAAGAELEVRSLAAEAAVTLREGEGELETGLPGGPVLRGTVGSGTRFEASTGLLRRADPRGSALETEGYARGERTARMRANLVITSGSVAHRDLALAFAGRTRVDLAAAIGFRVDPAAALAGRPAEAVRDPVGMDLDLTVAFAAGSSFRATQGEQETTLRLAGETRLTLHADAAVDASSGAPRLSALDGIDVTFEAAPADLRAVLAPMGEATTTRIESSTRVTIRQAKVTFLERGLRIAHAGVIFELTPGVIEIGTGR